ncbi:hypothetical protein H0A61_01174 [Koleobacter methoxysyntrophicus]|uniref:Uncharacterized protein n=1 Tax=Koleobacter methoxysyntrophicus TaxID=2751313 RepID=A0A8A0RMT0_9FIRM|nr:hypothetical protein H0A61_01174 [Koleobacter methoxysyntrophicus]
MIIITDKLLFLFLRTAVYIFLNGYILYSGYGKSGLINGKHISDC